MAAAATMPKVWLNGTDLKVVLQPCETNCRSELLRNFSSAQPGIEQKSDSPLIAGDARLAKCCDKITSGSRCALGRGARRSSGGRRHARSSYRGVQSLQARLALDKAGTTIPRA